MAAAPQGGNRRSLPETEAKQDTCEAPRGAGSVPSAGPLLGRGLVGRSGARDLMHVVTEVRRHRRWASGFGQPGARRRSCLRLGRLAAGGPRPRGRSPPLRSQSFESGPSPPPTWEHQAFLRGTFSSTFQGEGLEGIPANLPQNFKRPGKGLGHLPHNGKEGVFVGYSRSS